MRPETHLTAGLLVGTATGLAVGHPYIGMAAGAIGGILPDIDHPGTILYYIIGHRTLTHKVEFVLAASILLFMVGTIFNMPLAIGLSFMGGSLSHLLLDAPTRSGVTPFLLFPLHLSGPIKSRSIIINASLTVFFAYCTGKILGVL